MTVPGTVPAVAGGTAPEPAVLVTSRSFSSGALDLAAELEAAGLTVRRGPADHDLRLLRPLLAGSVAWIAGTGPVTAAHLSAAPRRCRSHSASPG